MWTVTRSSIGQIPMLCFIKLVSTLNIHIISRCNIKWSFFFFTFKSPFIDLLTLFYHICPSGHSAHHIMMVPVMLCQCCYVLHCNKPPPALTGLQDIIFWGGGGDDYGGSLVSCT
ncbi:hypothetical protein GDO81_025449 [Engystomops pustulosus]|uniref:Uncharacterized protein n=1 Tax=Engystomops pustulosus TaxID=76066 RepID=A0AAV6Z0J1_ENGPU|nr:hypothetical protein GDO81_025449 [Engystomops pustulosus]